MRPGSSSSERATTERLSSQTISMSSSDRACGGSPVVPELELHAEVLASQQRHHILQLVLARRRDPHLLPLDRRLHLLHLRILDRGDDLLRRVAAIKDAKMKKVQASIQGEQ